MAKGRTVDDNWLYDFLHENDGRKKFLICQEERVKYLYKIGWKYKDIRLAFNNNISYAQIHYILNPISKKRANINTLILKSKKDYYGKDKRRDDNKKHYEKKKRGSDITNNTLFDN